MNLIAKKRKMNGKLSLENEKKNTDEMNELLQQLLESTFHFMDF